jgi:hypothetical protein
MDSWADQIYLGHKGQAVMPNKSENRSDRVDGRVRYFAHVIFSGAHPVGQAEHDATAITGS